MFSLIYDVTVLEQQDWMLPVWTYVIEHSLGFPVWVLIPALNTN